MIQEVNFNESKSKGGRPKSGTTQERIERLLDDAAKVFLEYGYGLSSIDILARQAHVAKRTIYQHFGNKAELFGAVVRRLSDSVVLSFPHLGSDTRPIKQVLTAFAYQLLERVLSPEVLGLHRIVIGEACRFPELAKQFYDNGPGRAITALADYLLSQKELGVMELVEPKIAAEQFFNMVLGELYRRALLGIDPTPTPEKIREHIDCTVNLFLRGCRPS
ncbi:TetR/AcrR family transcriptional regulator [Fischerella sp. PCC 9605]|uniref:TetR/AcrR family transcriptional regulator n=1 Tax=Fischerella sp. PCC 9605 TaxID=1173024 RepID=UPI0004ACCCB2|nr:TetR/AcrR family transcriptional regulator [Fischerella sp. PCC 9605]